MSNLRLLLSAGFDVAVPGLKLDRLAVHRHLEEHPEIQLHRHDYSQLILYLSGFGRQHVNGSALPVSAGVCALIPPGVSHAFERTSGRPPLCLVLDFQSDGVGSPLSLKVPGTILADIKTAMQRIAKLEQASSPTAHIECIGLGMQILAWLLALFTPEPKANARLKDRIVRRVEALFTEPDGLQRSLREVAERTGYQQDHLNRLLKGRTGLNLSAIRARIRLQRARASLAKGSSVADAAQDAGFDDVSYFVRWFKKQTGVTPGASRNR